MNIKHIEVNRPSTHHNIPTHNKATVRRIRKLKWNISSQQNFFTKTRKESCDQNKSLKILLVSHSEKKNSLMVNSLNYVCL